MSKEQTILEGYKVVRPDLGWLQSAITWFGRVEYGQFWTQPKGGHGPLCVFEDLAEAQDFACLYLCFYEIYRCWYVPSAQTAIWWGRYRRYTFPPGTALADAVYLGEKLPYQSW